MRYYVYELRRPNGKPFYVGKGTRHRDSIHKWWAKKGKAGHVYNLIRKLWAEGKDFSVVRIAENLTDSDAKRIEQETIARYGRANNGGLLCNATNGGEGCVGYKHDLVSLARMRSAWEKRKLIPISAEQRRKMSAATKGRVVREETKQKISRSISGDRHWNYGKKITETHKEALHSVNRKKVIVNDVLFDSVGEAAIAHGIAKSTAVYRIRHGKNRSGYGKWKYVD
jgi:hypothetical protein